MAPRRPRDENRTRGYSRLDTLEMGSQSIATWATPTPTSTSTSTSTATADSAGQERTNDCFSKVESVINERCFVTAVASCMCTLILVTILLMDSGSEVVTDPEYDTENHRFQPFKFNLDSLIISEFRASEGEITGKCDVTMNITNADDGGRYAEISTLSIFLRHELLWIIRSRDFFLQGGESSSFNFSMNTTTISVPATYVPTLLLQSQKSRQPLDFKLKYDGMYRYGLGGWEEHRSHLYVVCGWIWMQFLNETTLKGGPASCYLEDP